MRLKPSELKDFLDEKVDKYNTKDFIPVDPISVPHLFEKKQDIEISGFLAATIAWGQRVTVVNNARKFVELMDYRPHDFVLNASPHDLKPLENFVHRTFNGTDALFFLRSLKHIYQTNDSLEALFKSENVKNGLVNFRTQFFSISHEKRTEKHVSNPERGASAKRLNMFLRWMVRSDNRGVDFGIWKSISLSQLHCPLDVHSGRVARKLGLLKRKQNDWKAVEELSVSLRKLDPIDPVKYDFALFGLGVFEKF